MVEVRTARAVRGSTPGRASAMVTVFEGLRQELRLPVAARELARSGVPVFPCAPGGKCPIPRRGFHEATTDLRQIEAWWRQRPGANIAIPTGGASGVIVVDVDVHGVNGYLAASRAARSGLMPEPMATVSTPTGGKHLYFATAPEREQRSWQVARAGVDFRGDGGFVIVPPSVRMIEGRQALYRVATVTAENAEPLDAQRLRDFLDPRPAHRYAGPLILSTPADVSRLVTRVASLREGEREIVRTVGSAYRHVSVYGPRTRAPARNPDALARSTASASSPLSRGL